MCRELHHLFKVIVDREIGEFTNCMFRIIGKELAVVSVEVNENNDIGKGGDSIYLILRFRYPKSFG